jgi:hypothetical protein
MSLRSDPAGGSGTLRPLAREDAEAVPPLVTIAR